MKVTINVEVSSQEEANNVVAKIYGTAPVNIVHHTGNEEEETGSTAGADGQVDKDGLPWDERIHSSSKKINANGKWARRKNVQDDYFNQVAAEIRGRYTGPATPSVVPQAPYTPPQPPAPPAPPANYVPPQPPYVPPAAPHVPHVPQVVHNPAPVAPGAPIPPELANIPQHMAYAPTPGQPPAPAYTPPQPPAPPAPPVHQPAAPAPGAAPTITDLFNKIQALCANGQADVNYMNSLTHRLSQQFQVQIMSINDIAGRPDMIGFAFQLLAQDGK